MACWRRVRGCRLLQRPRRKTRGPPSAPLAVLTAGVGTNLISNIVQRKYDEATAAHVIEAEVENDPKLRAELDAVLAQVEAVQAAHANLGDNWAVLLRNFWMN